MLLTAKIRQVALVLGAGKVTLEYPAKPHDPATGFRGLPAIDGERCLGCGACAHVCPARLLTLTTDDDRLVLTADFARCTYCARCADVCPTGAFQMTQRFETAVDDPARLTARVELAMAICTNCGRPTGHSTHMVQHLSKKLGVNHSTADLCPDCRKRAYGSKLKGGAKRG